MTLVEAIEEVILITKRADKRAEITSNINKAIAFWTLKADFARDLVEDTLTLDADAYSQAIDLSLVLTRFRKFKFIRPTSRNYFFHSIDPTQIIGPNNRVQTDRYYVVGQTLNITQSQLDSTAEIGYYQYAPLLSEGGTEAHWMLDMMPWAVTERAASQIFKAIGDEASSTHYAATSMEFFLAARRDFADNVADSAS